MGSAKKVVLAFSEGLLEAVDVVAADEHRSRSDLVREACRRYIQTWKSMKVTKAEKPNAGADE